MCELTLCQLMAAVVSSRCSHTRAEDGIPIGVDGIRIITSTAENILKAEVEKCFQSRLQNEVTDMDLMVSKVNKNTEEAYTWECRHRTIG